LRREGLEERYLLDAKWAWSASRDPDDAGGLSAAPEGCEEEAPDAGRSHPRLGLSVAVVQLLEIGQVDRAALDQRLDAHPGPASDRVAFPDPIGLGRIAARHRDKLVAVDDMNKRPGRVEDTGRSVGDGLVHRIDISR